MAHTVTIHEAADLSPIRIGRRVELHPATDAWVSGDRYGVVEAVGRELATILMDSGKHRKVAFRNVGRVVYE